MSSHTTSLVSPTSFRETLSGHKIPVLGYGVSGLCTTILIMFRSDVDHSYMKCIPENVAEDVTKTALQAGYRHFDSAAFYENEAQCAAAVRSAGLKRSDVFLTTKILPEFAGEGVGYEATKKCIQKSLERAQTSYFDLILIHTPYGGKEGRLGTWRALVEAQKAGKTRLIGVSNYGIPHLEELEHYIQSEVGGSIDVAQYELHPWLTRADLVEWLKRRGTVIEAYSPLVRGTRMTEPVLQSLSEKHGKSPAQILIRWSLQMGFIPLPKSCTPKRIMENTDVFDFELDAGDMNLLHTGNYSPSESDWDPTVEGLDK
ncbi:hypothetical protein N7513_007291 [Penicillium frequentans]|nr:hypothetical protein N7513_007291 [Penicillium glabrum]